MRRPPLWIEIDRTASAPRELVGGKAHSLITLARLDAPVPPAFTLTTEAYRAWASSGGRVLDTAIAEGMAALEARSGRSFGSGPDGLIVSVRSGAPVSMPGMMDTVLNVGLDGLHPTVDESYLHQARERFLWQFGELVLELDESELADARLALAALDLETATARAAQLEQLLREGAECSKVGWPDTPLGELRAVIEAVMRSWDSERARLYRRIRRIDDDLGTAVTVQQMVFGNRDAASGSGVAFTRDPGNGSPGLVGEYLQGGQGEDVVSGRTTPRGLDQWATEQPSQREQLELVARHLERASGRVQEIEFTIESGRLYLLQTRPAKLSTAAAVRIAVDMAEQGALTRAEALAYATAHGFDPTGDPVRRIVRPGAAPAGHGLAVGGGVASGRLIVSETEALETSRAGEPVVFAATETSPKHLTAMEQSVALLTMRGGATSHAAVVARELGIPCVVGMGGALDPSGITLAQAISVGETITVDGDAAAVYLGDVTCATSSLGHEETVLRRWAGSLEAGESTPARGPA